MLKSVRRDSESFEKSINLANGSNGDDIAILPEATAKVKEIFIKECSQQLGNQSDVYRENDEKSANNLLGVLFSGSTHNRSSWSTVIPQLQICGRSWYHSCPSNRGCGWPVSTFSKYSVKLVFIPKPKNPTYTAAKFPLSQFNFFLKLLKG